MNLRCCSSQSLLVPLPPSSLSFWERINKLLTPSVHVLGILRDSFKSGEQRQFAQRVWEMARSNEPFILASRALNQTYELWKENDETADEDDKKNPPWCFQATEYVSDTCCMHWILILPSDMLLILEISLCYQCIIILVHSILVCCIDT